MPVSHEDEELKRAIQESLVEFEKDKKKQDAEKQQAEIKKNFESKEALKSSQADQDDDDDDYLLDQHEHHAGGSDVDPDEED